jgi:chemotaxis receptor (MCP) glutamine deamidase CheD
MINLLDITSSQPLIILRGEYGIVKGDDMVITSPNAKSGIVLILTDAENKITALAHIDTQENIEENIDKILNEMTEAGANIKNLKCNLIENEKPS